MRFSVLAVLAAIPAFASAATVTIQVGANGLTYTPSNISAAVGDVIEFQFYAKNHTVSQSSFAAPCTPFVNTTTNVKGINSGFMPVAANATTFPVWRINITDTSPLWFFCEQTGHCQSGMVGSVNAVESSSKNYAAFKANAMSSAAPSSGSAPGYGSPSASGSGSGSPAASGSPKPNGASSLLVSGGATVALTVVSLAAGLFL